MKTDKPENPWKKRRRGPREFMPPSRALLVEYPDGGKDTATWCFYSGNVWRCLSASRGLRWMRGCNDPATARRMLAGFKDLHRCRWHWIEPNTVRVLAPPF